jgi:hypothetical protein
MTTCALGVSAMSQGEPESIQDYLKRKGAELDRHQQRITQEVLAWDQS